MVPASALDIPFPGPSLQMPSVLPEAIASLLQILLVCSVGPLWTMVADKTLAYALTAWGYQDCARDVKNGSMGGMFSKLLFRTVPDYYPEGSVYAQ